MRVRCTGEGDIALPNTSLERTPRSRPNRRKAPWSEQLRGGAAQLEAVRRPVAFPARLLGGTPVPYHSPDHIQTRRPLDAQDGSALPQRSMARQARQGSRVHIGLGYLRSVDCPESSRRWIRPPYPRHGELQELSLVQPLGQPGRNRAMASEA